MDDVIAPSILLSAAALTNIVLVLCLLHTWKRWTQIRWYVLMLTVGNCLEVLFTLTVQLGTAVTKTWQGGGDISCKALMFLETIGPSLANMALAAMAVHVLLTAITGCQGTVFRHVLVIALFSLLSLPLPVSKIPIYSVMSDEDNAVCSALSFFRDMEPRYRFYYHVAGAVALIFFPLIIILGAVGGATMFVCPGSRGTVKAEKNTAEVVFAAILGIVMLLCCVPLHGLIFHYNKLPIETMNIYLALLYLYYSCPTQTALVCVVFGYAYVYRKGAQAGQDNPRADHEAAGERTKLVN